MKTEYNSIENAVKKYPALKQTVSLAKQLNYTLFSHCAAFNKRGTVNSHWFRTDDGFERNQRILMLLKTINLKNKSHVSLQKNEVADKS